MVGTSRELFVQSTHKFGYINRYHFLDSLKLTNKYPILSKDLKEPLLSIKTSQEHTRLPCVVCFKRKFPKKLTIDFRFLGIILPEVSGN